jgi:hypothetical protein
VIFLSEEEFMLNKFSSSLGKPGTKILRQILKFYKKPTLRSGEYSPHYKEMGTYDAGFSKYYSVNLKVLVDEFESDRVAALISARKKLLWLTPLFFIIPILGWNILVWEYDYFDRPRFIGIYFIALSYLATIFYIYQSVNIYQTTIKTKIFPCILDFIGGFHYSATVSDIALQYKDTGIIPCFDQENSEDHIRGDYKDVSMDLFETHLQKWKGFGRSRRKETVFNGLIINLKLNKNFIGKTLVRADRGAAGNWFSKTLPDFETIKLEDPLFEEVFEVHSNNQKEAQCLLTANFMERLLELIKIFGGSKIEFCFENSSLLLMIPLRKPMFEPGPITEPEDFIDDAQSLLKEIHLIFRIVDTLQLNMQDAL